jgi:flavodoxin
MNTIVVYASHFGNTKRLARSIAATLDAFGSTRLVQAGPTSPLDLEGVDVLIAASPTEGFRQLPTMRAFLDRLSRVALGPVSVACFDTRIDMPWPMNGSAVKDMARQLRRKGVDLLVPPRSFFVKRMKGTQGAVLVDGEEESAVQWALTIHDIYEAAHLQAVARSS